MEDSQEKMTRRKFNKLLLIGAAIVGGGLVYSLMKRGGTSQIPQKPETQYEKGQGSSEKQSESYQQPKELSEPAISEKTTPKIPEYLEVDGKKIKNIWTENPNYVNKKLEDFKMPNGGLSLEEIEKDILRIRIKNENIEFDYVEVYRGINSKLSAINYRYHGDTKNKILISLVDVNSDGIIDRFMKETAYKRFTDTNGDGIIDSIYP